MTTKEYRGRHTIIAHMLNVINDTSIKGASKTLIMYSAFLSYAQLKEYLSFLVDKELVDEFPQQIQNSNIGQKKFTYKLTEKGRRFLQISREIESIIGLD
jgi:predicted transcriptional regulator